MKKTLDFGKNGHLDWAGFALDVFRETKISRMEGPMEAHKCTKFGGNQMTNELSMVD